jgi:bifunctional non-homologous end joining protein LigD
MARRDPVGIRLLTSRGNDWSECFPRVVEAVNLLKVRSCLIDGEVVCCNDEGVAEFQQLRQKRQHVHALLMAFDLLELNGTDLRREPIETRKATLLSVLHGCRPGIQFNQHLAHPGDVVFRHACKMRLEGHRLQALGLDLPIRAFTRLAQVQESGRAAVKREAEEDWGR